MQFLTAWKDSLSLLHPQRFLLFLLVTLKSIVQAYFVWLGYWWWLIGLHCLMYWLAGPGFVSWFHNFSWFHTFSQTAVQSMVGFLFILPPPAHSVVPTLSYVLLLLMLYLSVRPSTARKNYDYFGEYGRHAFYFATWFFMTRVFVMLFVSFHLAVSAVRDLPQVWLLAVSFPLALIAMVILSIVVCMPVFFVLFLFDSDARISSVLYSLGRSLKMAVYNAPLCSLIVLFLLSTGAALTFLFEMVVDFFQVSLYVHYALLATLYVLMLPLPVCFLTNVYVKRLYDNFNYYY